MVTRFGKLAYWFSGTLLVLASGCSQGTLKTEGQQPAGESVQTTTSHYLSGQIVSVDRVKGALGVREAVEINRRKVTRLRLTPATAVLEAGEPGSLSQIRKGDFVMIRYSDRPDGGSYAEEVQVVSKSDHRAPQTKPGEGDSTSQGSQDEPAVSSSSIGG